MINEDTSLNSLHAEVARIENLKQDLSEFFNEPLDVVETKMKTSVLDQVVSWHEREGSVEDYYRHNKYYVYGGVWWNDLQGVQRTRLLPLIHIKNAKVLDLGCGIGCASFILAGQGNRVTGYDINTIAIDFSNFRKSKCGLDVEFTIEKPDVSQFDFVVAIDVLEHIEDLHTFLKELGSMKSGARLYHYDNFKDTGLGDPQHFDHSKNFNQWLKEAGFTIRDNIWATKI